MKDFVGVGAGIFNQKEIPEAPCFYAVRSLAEKLLLWAVAYAAVRPDGGDLETL